MAITSLRELGISECDHHQCEVISSLAGIGDVHRGIGRPDKVRYDDTSKRCVLCGAHLIGGAFVGGSIDFLFYTDKINMELLRVRFNI